MEPVAQMVGLAPGQRPGAVTGQPATGLRIERSGPADLAAQGAGAAKQAVQVHGDGELEPDPSGVGKLSGLQDAAGQLVQGVGAALAPAAGIVGIGGAGQRFQGRQQRRRRPGRRPRPVP